MWVKNRGLRVFTQPQRVTIDRLTASSMASWLLLRRIPMTWVASTWWSKGRDRCPARLVQLCGWSLARAYILAATATRRALEQPLVERHTRPSTASALWRRNTSRDVAGNLDSRAEDNQPLERIRPTRNFFTVDDPRTQTPRTIPSSCWC